MKKKLLIIVLNFVKLGSWKGDYLVYAANNFINALKTFVYVAFSFILVWILKQNGVILNNYILIILGIIVWVLGNFFDKNQEKDLFEEYHKLKGEKTSVGKGLLAMVILFLILGLVFFIGTHTVQGYFNLNH